MPLDLEKELYEIKVELGVMKEGIKSINDKLVVSNKYYEDIEYRVRELENFKWKLIGGTATISFVISLTVAVLIKIL